LRTHQAGRDAFGTGGDAYERAIRKAIGGLKTGAWQHPDYLPSKPLGTDQHSSNEVHDHRVVQSETNIHVAGGLPVEKTRNPLARPKMADVIRNTSSYVS
jgi:hypothetical protein